MQKFQFITTSDLLPDIPQETINYLQISINDLMYAFFSVFNFATDWDDIYGAIESYFYDEERENEEYAHSFLVHLNEVLCAYGDWNVKAARLFGFLREKYNGELTETDIYIYKNGDLLITLIFDELEGPDDTMPLDHGQETFTLRGPTLNTHKLYTRVKMV